ncbi:MAG: aminotransferase class I/II-fold pyridoxal phosphate-dependent enzyme, partial [Myxococcota bacterium]
MSYAQRPIDLIDEAIQEGVDHHTGHLSVEDERLNGRQIRVSGETLTSFASCSYLGLELDPRLRQGAVDAVERYGVQFSCSRAYLSAPGYAELEALLDRIFEAHTLVTPNTTLAHMCALPVMIAPEDAVILDQCAHSSVQMAAGLLRLQGTKLEMIRNNRIEQLDDTLRELAPKHPRVFYLCDGIYSMYGEIAPFQALQWLLERHPNLHLYVDDAHAMSWTGRHGRGLAAEAFPGHERVTIAVSLNKSFGAGGGALVFNDREQHRKVRCAALPLIFTGPLQPPLLGAAIASAHIHLSPEIETLQAALRERIELANRTARELDLPVVRQDDAPIRFLGVSAKEAMFSIQSALADEGFYLCPASFPAVGSRQSGARFTLTLHHRPEDIVALLEAAARHLPAALEAAGISRADVDRAYGIESRTRGVARPAGRARLELEHTTGIRE